MNTKRLKRILYLWRVRTGFIISLAALILARPNWTFLLAGLAVCAAGLILRGWAAGYLRKEKELAAYGPYRYTRNPLYLGNFILIIAISLACRSLWVALLYFLYLLIFFPAIISYENRRMESFFPESFFEYRKRVPAFFPTLKPVRKHKDRQFSWEVFKKNKEIRASTGAAVFWALLLLKMFVF